MREMKDSGIQWLREYPANWNLIKIKYCLKERVDKNNPVRTTDILSLTAKQGVIPYDQKEGGGNKPKEDVKCIPISISRGYCNEQHEYPIWFSWIV